ncbi:MAG TPA: CaiB/BaiF CoA-transferase family protein [Thermoanaerobaculia bacterium]|nr:CaiB/BaiF CoA-transferase family protein [Thermoanaerobaculia bacterium]
MLVVDLSRLLPGPLTAKLLADLGARVVKVEEPRMGDPLRMAPPLVRGRSALAALLLAGVESVALDLGNPGARDVLEDLLARADVLLESFRPGTLARLGFPPRELARRFPRLVVCSLSGYGQEGPQAPRAGHDLTYQALAGTLAPTARMPAVPVADVAGAWSAALAVVAALYRRGATGRGARVDASLYDAALHANVAAWAEEGAGEREVGRALPLTGSLPCYNLYLTADRRYVALACLEPRFWKRFCAVVGRADLEKRHLDARLEARQRVQEVIGGRTRDAWEALAREHDLPLEPVLSAAEARRHPQARERRVVSTGPDGLLRLAYPALLDGERPEAAERLPRLGDDTPAVLAELGRAMRPAEQRAAGVGRRLGVKRVLARIGLRWKGRRG